MTWVVRVPSQGFNYTALLLLRCCTSACVLMWASKLYSRQRLLSMPSTTVGHLEYYSWPEFSAIFVIHNCIEKVGKILFRKRVRIVSAFAYLK